jgi:hypothetical protein
MIFLIYTCYRALNAFIHLGTAFKKMITTQIIIDKVSIKFINPGFA